MLSKNREVELSELAEFIADQYCPKNIVEPSIIAEAKGITFCYGEYGDAFDGLIEHEDGNFHIYINSTRNGYGSPRTRFTFAHELGHYFIDEHRQALLSGKTPSHPSYTNFSSKNPVEIEADFFAASLLMPEHRVKKDCYRKKFTFALVEELSKKYDVSITATILKIMTIDHHPLMIVCSVNNKIKWFKYSHDFPFKWLKLPKGIVPPESLAGAYFNSKEKFEHAFPIIADDWFEYVPENQFDKKFYEKCIYADKYNFVLSIIWED
jgi:Zn-dependent peptidase ImmA (M78 family)